MSKITHYKVLVRPISLNAYGTWATIQSDELKLATFEWMILKILYGSKINKEGEYEVRTNQKINELYGEATNNGVYKVVN